MPLGILPEVDKTDSLWENYTGDVDSSAPPARKLLTASDFGMISPPTKHLVVVERVAARIMWKTWAPCVLLFVCRGPFQLRQLQRQLEFSLLCGMASRLAVSCLSFAFGEPQVDWAILGFGVLGADMRAS